MAEPASLDDPTDTSSGKAIFLRACAALAGFVLIGAVLKESAAFSPESLSRWMGHGPRAAALFILIGAAGCAGGLPRQAIAFAGGYLFGFSEGFVAAMAAQTIGCIAGFFWARGVGRRWARRYMQRGRLARADRFLSTRPFAATLTLRLLPIGNNMALTTVAGLSGIDAGPFLIASFIGFIPQTIIFTLLGSGIEVARGWRIGLAVGLFVISGALGAWLLRRYRNRPAADRAGLTQNQMDEILER